MNTTVNKIRPDDVLGNLTEDQQNTILDWCEEFSYREVLTRIAAPPPEGLGLNIRYTSLRRFFLKRFPERFLRDRASAMTHWEEIAHQLESQDFGPFWLMAKEALEKHIFTRLQKDEFDQRELASLLRLTLRMEDQRLKWHVHYTAADRLHLEDRQFSAQQKEREKTAALFARMGRPQPDQSASPQPQKTT